MCPRSPGSPQHSSARTAQTAHSLRYSPERPAARMYPLPTARPLLRRLRRALPVSRVSPARRTAPPRVPALPSDALRLPGPELQKKIVDGVLEEIDGRSFEELSQERD